VHYATEASFYYYHIAKSKTDEYLKDINPKMPNSHTYYEAINYWESFFLNMQIFTTLYNQISETIGINKKVYDKNDGSKYQRLYDIANCIKHFSSNNLKMAVESKYWAPLWLSNQGFKSFEHQLSYDEAFELLHEAASFADKYSNPVLLKK
jgi:poly-D-alanine transfer protein DltD